MLFDILGIGAESARPAAELARFYNCHVREICARIEAERREGLPICANEKGYYIAGERAELENYIQTLKKRARAINKTAGSLAKRLKDYAE